MMENLNSKTGMYFLNLVATCFKTLNKSQFVSYKPSFKNVDQISNPSSFGWNITKKTARNRYESNHQNLDSPKRSGRNNQTKNETHKNKMKPTNPNADTYVDKQRQYLFVMCLANSLVKHPEFIHWGDTIAWSSYLTLL